MKPFRIFFIFIFLFSITLAHADTIGDLKNKINDRASNIKQLEDEIKGYQSQITDLGKQADSLKNTLAELDLSKKKLETNLKVTQAKIEATNSDIKDLGTQINDKSDRISDSRRVISQSLASISESDSSSLIENMLGAQTLAQTWNGAEELITLQSNVKDRIHDLQAVKAGLEDNKNKTEQKKAELLSLQTDLSNQKKILADTVSEKNSLLAATKNTESSYRSIVSQKEAQKAMFEKELFQYESALKVAIDPSLLPSIQHGILAYPLKSILVTQYFGKTVAARRLYVSGTHGGMDFAASIGTQVMAAMGGTVTDTTTYAKSGCQYGKFVLIKHPNGLSTLYGHLSLVSVSPGEEVSTGQVIGYSGSTGYATGPHLHFGVYATQGVRVVNASALGSTSCAGIKTVAAPPNAYLDPLLYL